MKVVMTMNWHVWNGDSMKNSDQDMADEISWVVYCEVDLQAISFCRTFLVCLRVYEQCEI